MSLPLTHIDILSLHACRFSVSRGTVIANSVSQAVGSF
jgi:hypothetical protein